MGLFAGYGKKHQAKGNGFGFGLVTPNSITRTLSARYYKDGSEILVYQGEGVNPRRLTPENARDGWASLTRSGFRCRIHGL
jgi:hypothetical protein